MLVTSAASTLLSDDQIWAKSDSCQSCRVSQTNSTLCLPSRDKRDRIVPSCPHRSVPGSGEAHMDKLSRNFWTFRGATFLIACSLGCCRLLTGCQGNHETHISCLFTRCFHGNLRVCLELPGSLSCQWHCNKIWQTLFETILYFVEIYNLSWLLFFSLHGMRPFRKRSFWKVTMIALINWITYLGVHVLMCKPVRCGTPADVRGQHGGWILFFHHVGLNSDFSCLVASTFTR